MGSAVGPDEVRREAVQMRLVARRDLQGGGFDFDEAFGVEPPPQRAQGARARKKPRAPVGVAVLAPEGRSGFQIEGFRWRAEGNRQFGSDLVFGGEIGMLRAAIAQVSTRQTGLRPSSPRKATRAINGE